MTIQDCINQAARELGWTEEMIKDAAKFADFHCPRDQRMNAVFNCEVDEGDARELIANFKAQAKACEENPDAFLAEVRALGARRSALN